MSDATASAPPQRAGRRRIEPRAVIAVVLFVAIIGLAIWYLARPEPLLVQGEVEATRIDIAARVASGSLVLIGRMLAHATIYVPPLALFLAILPRIYGFSTLGHVGALALFGLPFVFAVSLMGQFAGLLFKHRETAVLVFVATTLPHFFLVGVSWPREMIPQLLEQVRRVSPSESAIDGLVRINQMGASLSEVRADWVRIWLLIAAYFALALAAGWWRAERAFAHAR